ncbi:RNA-binding S4 domain-containing protein [Erythrobacter sp. SDW2]|uniref:RNA-binding S4 domain-containing protein n=1 Tax=Erythrobacter sp. SDW2 TaxID=2907154 RepID=UPI001F2E9B94|nr:RNA-binding S4 domain-containing protein [Erythrobacter sp. SDW2]UIP07337.1 RNA-binding S4 domain-containing protein [Erythrobacter sp. SDW2]
MRLDLALVRLRFVKTRSLARAMVEQGHVRINGLRTVHPSHAVKAGDVLTLPRGSSVLVAEILTLPQRRGPPSEAQSCYHVLDQIGRAP